MIEPSAVVAGILAVTYPPNTYLVWCCIYFCVAFISGGCVTLTPEVEAIVHNLASDGKMFYPWDQIQKLLEVIMVRNLDESNAVAPDCPNVDGESFLEERHRLVVALRAFDK